MKPSSIISRKHLQVSGQAPLRQPAVPVNSCVSSSAVELAINSLDLAQITNWLRSGYNPDRMMTRAGMTILLRAVIEENHSLAQLALEHGANPDQVRGGNGIPLLEAVKRNDGTMADLLVQNGARTDFYFETLSGSKRHLASLVMEKRMLPLARFMLPALSLKIINDPNYPLLHILLANLKCSKLVDGKTKYYLVDTDLVFSLLDKGANPRILCKGLMASQVVSHAWPELFMEDNFSHAALAIYSTLQQKQLESITHMSAKDSEETRIL